MRKPHEIETAFAPRAELDQAQRFFLVGIAGAGMSGLARMLRKRGIEVLGTDANPDKEGERLRLEGIQVHAGHSGEALRPGDALILSDAIDLDTSPEVARARELGVPLYRRSQLLGWLVKDKKVIAITGTHGKTTTTGLAGRGLIEAGLDPLVIVGAAIPEWGGPIREGEGDWAVVEACEAYNGFHDLDPVLVVLTNLEPDHLDFHENWENLRASVVRFVNKVGDGGMLIYCADDRGASEVAEHTNARAFGYGLSREWFAQTLNKLQGMLPGLAVEGAELPEIGRLEGLALPGTHNALNAIGALVACIFAGADRELAYEGIRGFTGAERRLQVIEDREITVIDDYAHHPTEIAASIEALRSRYADRRLVVVFQPHLYSRTAEFIPEFAETLSRADVLVLTDIYPAREAPMPGISSARIADLTTCPTHYVPSRHILPREVLKLAKPGDVVVGMGAGNISEFAPSFATEWTRSREAGRKPSVAVVCGGDTSEREVSLHSGRAILAALNERGYPAFLLDPTESLFGSGFGKLTGDNHPDVLFHTVHGTHLEGGGIQGLAEMLHLPYTGSGVLASALAMSKSAAKDRFGASGLRVPGGLLVTSADDARLSEFPVPCVVKPNAEGSTVGLTFADSREQLIEGVKRALAYDRSVLVEEKLVGMEITVPVLGDRALPVVEIVPASGRYDFAMKYLPGATEEIAPARLSPEVTALAQSMAVRAHAALGCAGATRVDMIVVGDQPVILELNTLPGMTATSLLPTSAKAAGMSFEDLVEWIVTDALERARA